jgi:hypothetical protein
VRNQRYDLSNIRTVVGACSRRLAMVGLGSLLLFVSTATVHASDAGSEINVPAPPIPFGPLKAAVEVPVGGEGSGALRFMFITGSNFQPRGGGSYAYGGVGCVHLASGGTDFFTIDLQLPDGVVIDFLRLYYYDASASANLRAYLTEYDGQGGYSDIFSTDSAGSGGYGSAGDYFSYTVDNTTHSLSVLVRPNGASSDLALCGVRLRYQDLTVIFADGFESGSTSAWTTTSP